MTRGGTPYFGPICRARRLMAGEHVACRRDHASCQAPVDVRFERQHDFGLRPIALDDDGQRLGDVAERLIDDVLADAARERLGANAGEPLGKRRTLRHPALEHDGCASQGTQSDYERADLERMIHPLSLQPSALRSVRRHRPGAGARPLHQQDQRQKREEDDPEKLEEADERDHGRLSLHHAEERPIGAVGRRHGVGPGGHEPCRICANIDWVAGSIAVTCEPKHGDVRLLMAGHHGAGDRDADAAADVAHQVEEAGRVAHALARDGVHRHRGQRHEQQRQAGALHQLRPEDVPVAGLQVQPATARAACRRRRAGRG